MTKEISLMILTILVLAGCGAKDKDPIKNYPNAKNAEPPHDNIRRSQQAFTCPVYVDAKPMFESYEGKTTHFEFYVIGDGAQNEGVTVKDKPKGLDVKSAGMEGNIHRFILTYTPPVGLIEHDESHVNFDIVLHPNSNSKLDCSAKVGIRVNRSNAGPEIVDIKHPLEITLGATKAEAIRVRVKDTTIKDASDLMITLNPDPSVDSKSNPTYDLTQALRNPGRGEKDGDGYLFVLDINTEIIEILLADEMKANPKQTTFQMVAQITVENLENDLDSDSKNILILVQKPQLEGESK